MASTSTTFHGRGWAISREQTWEEVTSEFPTSDERWRHTDANGHEHYYDRGYPTLDEIIDAQHWCDGTEGIWNHDPHMAVDESHFECRICREVVTPGTRPPGAVARIPGMVTVRAEGRRSDGAQIEGWLMESEWQAIIAADDRDAAVLSVLDALPPDRIHSLTYRFG